MSIYMTPTILFLHTSSKKGTALHFYKEEVKFKSDLKSLLFSQTRNNYIHLRLVFKIYIPPDTILSGARKIQSHKL